MPDVMPRRAFVTLLGGAAIWSHAARAQKSEGVRRVGVIMGFAENDEVWQAFLSTFRQALQNLGWTEGRNIRFDYRSQGASGRADAPHGRGRSSGLAPDAILGSPNSVVSATLNATRSIPCRLHLGVRSCPKWFRSLNLHHPGGKITGFHNFEPAIGGKWLAYLNQIAPGVRRVAVMQCSQARLNVAFLRVVEAVAPQMGITVSPAEIRKPLTTSNGYRRISDSRVVASS